MVPVNVLAIPLAICPSSSEQLIQLNLCALLRIFRIFPDSASIVVETFKGVESYIL